jgi:hypothetical protein
MVSDQIKVFREERSIVTFIACMKEFIFDYIIFGF